jgi:hypothetical protein
MGYHKQKMLEEIEEVIPRPVPATDHVALKRRNLRPRKQSVPVWVPLTFAGLFVFSAGVTVGVIL